MNAILLTWLPFLIMFLFVCVLFFLCLCVRYLDFQEQERRDLESYRLWEMQEANLDLFIRSQFNCNMETESETPTVIDTFETANTEIVVEGPDVEANRPLEFEVIAEESEPRAPVAPPFKGITVHAKIVVPKGDQCVDHFVRNSNVKFLNKSNNDYLVSLGIPPEQADTCHTMMHYCANMFEVARQLGGTVEGIHFTSHA